MTLRFQVVEADEGVLYALVDFHEVAHDGSLCVVVRVGSEPEPTLMFNLSSKNRTDWAVVSAAVEGAEWAFDDLTRPRHRPRLVARLKELAAEHVCAPVEAPPPPPVRQPPRAGVVVVPVPLPACPPPAPVVREELAIEEDYLAPYRVEVEVEVLPGGVALMRAHLCDGVILLAFSPEQRRSWPHVSWEIGQAVDAWYAEAPGGPPHVFTQSGLRYTLQTYAHSRVVLQ